MTWSIEIPENIEEIIGSIEDNDLQQEILDKLEDMQEDPYPHIKKLRGVLFYRFRVKGWRGIVYLKNKKLVVMVLRLSPRNISYRDLKRLQSNL